MSPTYPVAGDGCGESLYHHITSEACFFNVINLVAPAATYQTTRKIF
jgi:hypothetical protein